MVSKAETQVKEIYTKVVGVTHKDPHSGIDRQWLIKKFVHPGTKLIPQLEPTNPYDPDAVMLWLKVKRKPLLKLLSGKDLHFHIGYLQRELAKDIARILRSKRRVDITVLEITGGTKAKPTCGMNIVLRYRK